MRRPDGPPPPTDIDVLVFDARGGTLPDAAELASRFTGVDLLAWRDVRGRPRLVERATGEPYAAMSTSASAAGHVAVAIAGAGSHAPMQVGVDLVQVSRVGSEARARSWARTEAAAKLQGTGVTFSGWIDQPPFELVELVLPGIVLAVAASHPAADVRLHVDDGSLSGHPLLLREGGRIVRAAADRAAGAAGSAG